MSSFYTDLSGDGHLRGDLHLEEGKTVKVNGVNALGGGGFPSAFNLLGSPATVDAQNDQAQTLWTVPAGKQIFLMGIILFGAVNVDIQDDPPMVTWYTNISIGQTASGFRPIQSRIQIPDTGSANFILAGQSYSADLNGIAHDGYHIAQPGEVLGIALPSLSSTPGHFKVQALGFDATAMLA